MFSDEIPKKQLEGDGTPAWMLTFADLVSLLLCFFVLLYSMRSVDEKAWKEIAGSFAGALSNNQKFKKLNPNNNSGAEVERILSSDSMSYIQSVLLTKFSKNDMLKHIQLFKSNEDSSLHIKIPSKYIFEKDSDILTEKGYKFLYLIASSIMYLDGDINVASYVKENEEFDDEIQKSLLQSLKVRKIFKSQGVLGKIKAVGFGSKKYELMKDLYAKDIVEKEAVALEVIIETKMF